MSKTLREALTDVLAAHGVARATELVDDLVKAADHHSEWWPDETVAWYVGSISPATVKQWVHAHGIVRRQMSRAEEVRAERDKMPGRGYRSDRQGRTPGA